MQKTLIVFTGKEGEMKYKSTIEASAVKILEAAAKLIAQIRSQDNTLDIEVFEVGEGITSTLIKQAMANFDPTIGLILERVTSGDGTDELSLSIKSAETEVIAHLCSVELKPVMAYTSTLPETLDDTPETLDDTPEILDDTPEVADEVLETNEDQGTVLDI